MNILILGPESRNADIRKFLESKGNQVIITANEISLGFLGSHSIDLVLSSGYAPIIKEPILSAYQGRIINLHISYLPWGRGMYPNFWSFFENTPKGVTLHLIDPGIDSGAILFQRQVQFTDDETLQTSHTKLMKALEGLFFEKWDEITSGSVNPTSQTVSDASVRNHSKVETERLMDLLPLIWHTPGSVVERMGAEMSASMQFWQRYDEDISEMRETY